MMRHRERGNVRRTAGELAGRRFDPPDGQTESVRRASRQPCDTRTVTTDDATTTDTTTTGGATIGMLPIGVVRNERSEAIDDDWDRVNSRIELDLDLLGADATEGLRAFSHVEVLYVFDRVDPDTVTRGSRHPRGNPDWPKVGILAQRAKNRPNRIGTTVCELMAVRPGGVIEVRGLDAIDGTPVLDIKPYIPAFERKDDVRLPAWVNKMMDGYF